MQKSASGKKKIKIVTKPMMTGRAVDEATFKRALRVAGTTLVAVIIYLLFGAMLMFDNIILRVVTNVALIAMCGGLLYMSGASHGEADAAFGEIMYQREAEGKAVPDSEKARCFAPAKGAVTTLLGALPYVLLALILAVTAQLQTYALGVLPSWVSVYQRRPEIGDALKYYQTASSIGFLDIVRLVVRMFILPFISLVGSSNAHAVLAVERLSPLLVLIVPAGYALGYLRGRELRSRVHTSIAQSRRKKKKRDKKERQRRQQKGPEQLV